MAIPKAMRDKYEDIAPLITEFCEERLDGDYLALCLRLLEKLCRKRPSPLLSGREETRAAGIVYAIAATTVSSTGKTPVTWPRGTSPTPSISPPPPPATRFPRSANCLIFTR